MKKFVTNYVYSEFFPTTKILTEANICFILLSRKFKSEILVYVFP